MRNILVFCIASLFLASCAGKYSLQKRKYNKGYYFAHSGRTNNTLKKSEPEKQNKNKKELIESVPAEVMVLHKEAESQKNSIPQPIKKEQKLLAVAKAKLAEPLKAYQLKHHNQFHSLYNNQKVKHPPYQYGYANGGMGVWGIIGAISSIISLIFLFIYLAIMFDAVTGGAFTTAIITGFAILAVILIIAVIAVAVSGMGG
ncbi:MAG: hypothetical protein IPM51_08180 [Sphingobacteriaceae bacterium]|nr:hypothetical protein [Sphingobacteriaceae bacterium]